MAFRRSLPSKKEQPKFEQDIKEEKLISKITHTIPPLERNETFEPKRKAFAIFTGIILCTVVLAAVLVQDENKSLLSFQIQKYQYRKDMDLKTSLSSNEKQCSIWLAPSSLPGMAGYGIYTTRALEEAESILGGPDGISIPMEIPFVKRFKEKMPEYAKALHDWLYLWGNYYWRRGVPDHVAYSSPPRTVDFQIGFGVYPNHHCILDYLDHIYPERPYEDSLVDRFSSPGAGAFTYSRGREFTVSDHMQPGEEIFLNYGYCSHNDEENPDWTDAIFMTKDFREATELIYEHYKLESYLHENSDKSIEDAISLLSDEDIKPMLHISSKDYDTINLPKGTSALVTNLIPSTKTELDALIPLKARGNKQKLLLIIARSSLEPRTPEWIKYNGFCLQNIVPKPSTIVHAGQGAFSQFHIKKGSIIVPTPLLQIMNKEALSLYNTEFNTETESWEPKEKIGQQLLLNYCFGHSESSILLCPISNAALINHCSSRITNSTCKTNAKIQWSSGWDPTSDEWQKLSFEDLNEKNGRGLAFEIIALEEINKNEEIFIDYGIEWEEAWDAHTKRWSAPKSMEHFVSAKEANIMPELIFDELISNNLRAKVEHPHLFVGCQYWESREDSKRAYKRRNKNWRDLSDEQILKKYATDGKRFRYRHSSGYARHGDKSHWPCVILKEHEKSDRLIVRIYQSPFEDPLPWDDLGVPRILYNYPRESIHYFVDPKSSDHHLKTAFRHPIMIPNDIPFPDAWKNMKNTTKF